MARLVRLARLVAHNWPLKVAALGLATLLYAGLVLAQNAQVWSGRITVTPLRQPAEAVLVGTIPDVTQIRYFAPVDVAARVSGASFTATLDLTDATPATGTPYVLARIEVTPTDPRVQVIDFEPQVVRVQLDPLVRRQVPVEVDRGPVPTGLTVREPELSATTVTVSGPESAVGLVTAARARVLIQPSGIDVDELVDLVAVDAAGNVVGPVDIAPGSVRVRIRVGSQLQTRTLPVHAVVTGSPADGWEVASVAVVPAVVLVEGEADLLAALDRVDTAPVSVADARADVSATVQLALPDDVAVLGAQTARVAVAVRAVTGTRTFSAGIVPTGARGDRGYAFSVGAVTVVLGGPVGDLDALDAATLVVVADVSELGLGTTSVRLRLVAPTGLTLISISPGTVDVTVTAPS